MSWPRCITERRAVRATTLLRTTIHLVSARDALVRCAPLMQPVAERQWRIQPVRPALAGVDVDEVVAAGLSHARRAPAHHRRAREAAARALAGPRGRGPRLRHPLPGRPGADPAARRVGPERPARPRYDRAVAGPAAGGRTPRRRPRAALPGGLRSGHREGRPDLELADRHRARCSSGFGPACARFATRPAASSSTSPTRRFRTRTPRRRSASCPSTTTWSSPMTIAAASSTAASGSMAGCAARSLSTASFAEPGGRTRSGDVATLQIATVRRRGRRRPMPRSRRRPPACSTSFAADAAVTREIQLREGTDRDRLAYARA